MAADGRTSALNNFRIALGSVQQQWAYYPGSAHRANALEVLGRQLRNHSMNEIYYMGSDKKKQSDLLQTKSELRARAERHDEMLRELAGEIKDLMSPAELKSAHRMLSGIPEQDAWVVFACRAALPRTGESRLLSSKSSDEVAAGDWSLLAKAISEAERLFVSHFDYSFENGWSSKNLQGIDLPELGLL